MPELNASTGGRSDAPPWAESSERDDEALIHSRSIGVLRDLDGTPLSVEVVQRDELAFGAKPAAVRRTEPYIRVGGQRMDSDRAHRLSRLLSTAGDLASSSTATSDPEPPPW